MTQWLLEPSGLQDTAALVEPPNLRRSNTGALPACPSQKPRKRRYGLLGRVIVCAVAVTLIGTSCSTNGWSLRLKGLGIKYEGVEASTDVEVVVPPSPIRTNGISK
jgi:hypothetical protein